MKIITLPEYAPQSQYDLLTLLAFFFHQIFELSDPDYQLCRKSYVNKMALWETFRTLIIYFIFDSWNDAFSKSLEARANAKVHQINKHFLQGHYALKSAG